MRTGAEMIERVGAVARRVDVVAFGEERVAEGEAQLVVVLDDQDTSAAAGLCGQDSTWMPLDSGRYASIKSSSLSPCCAHR